MTQRPTRFLSVLLIAVVLFGVSSCSTAPYRYEPLGSTGILERAESQQQGNFAVRAAVPSEEEAERILGAPFYERGIQPVWIEIANRGPSRARVVLSSVDRDYFPPYEVAWFFRKKFSKDGWRDMEDYLYASTLPRQIEPGTTVSGFVFTNADTGTKGFNLDLFGTGEEASYEQFTFFLQVPGFVADYRQVSSRTCTPRRRSATWTPTGCANCSPNYPAARPTATAAPAGARCSCFSWRRASICSAPCSARSGTKARMNATRTT
jgi:hypothetical protein